MMIEEVSVVSHQYRIFVIFVTFYYRWFVHTILVDDLVEG